jgi:hypothetical protein
LVDEHLTTYLQSLDSTFEHASNKLTLLLSESHRQESRIQALIDATQAQLTQLECDKELLVREKTSKEVEIEDGQRQIKQLDEDKAGFLHLKQLEALNLRSTHEAAMATKQLSVKQCQAEIELL